VKGIYFESDFTRTNLFAGAPLRAGFVEDNARTTCKRAGATSVAATPMAQASGPLTPTSAAPFAGMVEAIEAAIVCMLS
jgi:hypothetical protein